MLILFDCQVHSTLFGTTFIRVLLLRPWGFSPAALLYPAATYISYTSATEAEVEG